MIVGGLLLTILHCDADPHTTFHFDADPEAHSTFHFDADKAMKNLP
jgi:hypothetical protein